HYNPNDALPVLEEALTISPDHDSCLSMLAENLFLKGDLDAAREVGVRAITIRANSAEDTDFDPCSTPVPRFRHDTRERNVISFSLWGSNKRYLAGALRNVKLASDIYPDWLCRFYVDETVPKETLDAIKHHHADLVVMPKAARNFD